MEKFENEKAELIAMNDKAKGEAMTQANNMKDAAVSIVRAASEMGQLFGSVTARDISAALVEAGHQIDRNQVVMDKAIKTLGLFDMRVKLHAEVDVTVTVNIARSLEEAATQLESGKAVIASELLDADDEVEAVEEAPAAVEEAAADDASENAE